jgi:Transposase DDE domain group 1
VGKSTSWFPKLSVVGGGSGVVSHAGAVLLVRVAERTGLIGALSTGLARWRKPLASHDPGKVVLDLAVALALGGDCLAGVAQLRAHPQVFGPVASDPTVSRLIATLAADTPTALSAINAARAAARASAWSLAGCRARDQGVDETQPLVVDIDATLVTTHSRQGTGGPDLQARLRISPVVRVRRPRPAGTGEPLAMLLRPGNAGANTAADNKTVLADALAQLPAITGYRVGRKVLIRADAGGGTHEFLDHLTARRLAYSVGFGLSETMVARLALIPRGRGPLPTTATARCARAPGSPKLQACWSCRVGHRGCGSLCARNARIRAPSCGSPTPTGCG